MTWVCVPTSFELSCAEYLGSVADREQTGAVPRFDGFPADSLDFYARLERENTRDFWQANKATYDACVREPMAALLEELAPEFGEASMFRPQRDIRFSKDKSPYKTYQGGFVAVSPGTGYYVHIDARGLLAGGGFHAHSPEQVHSYRAAVDAEDRGGMLAGIVGTLEAAAFEVGGEAVKTAPRGYRPDHPRIELLRHKELTVGRAFGAPPWLSTAAALDEARLAWRQVRPLNDWLDENVGAPS
jgi:uncharacterized protein (TIGR02453 family)